MVGCPAVGSAASRGILAAMQINRQVLNRRVADFLRSPGAGRVFDEIESSIDVRLIAAAIGIALACIAMATIVWLPRGARALWEILRGGVPRDRWGHLRYEAVELIGLITYGIIIGPQGYGLVLGTFDERVEQETTFLALKARELARLYADGVDKLHDEEIARLLHDDAYRPNRRRRVP